MSEPKTKDPEEARFACVDKWVKLVCETFGRAPTAGLLETFRLIVGAYDCYWIDKGFRAALTKEKFFPSPAAVVEGIFDQGPKVWKAIG